VGENLVGIWWEQMREGKGRGATEWVVGFKGVPLSYLSLSTSSTLNISSRRVISEAIMCRFGQTKGRCGFLRIAKVERRLFRASYLFIFNSPEVGVPQLELKIRLFSPSHH
jgi:hypothetical protein